MPSATEGTKGARGDFGWGFRILSAVMTTLALVALARHAHATWSLSAPMALVLDAYNATMQLLLGWAQPYLQAAITWLGGFFGFRLTLETYWRDLFVICALMMGAIFGSTKDFQSRVGVSLATLYVSFVMAMFGGIHTQPLPDPAIGLIMAGLVLLIAIVLILLGWMGWDKRSDMSFYRAGLTILTGFIGAFSFFAIDAGLKLLLP
jgi:hypothetical protein